MHKNLLFIGLLLIIIINSNNLAAEISLKIPLKKPTLTEKEIVKKLSKNILIPIKKPKKIKSIKIEEEKIVEIKKTKKFKKLTFKNT